MICNSETSDFSISQASEKDVPQVAEIEKICFAHPWSYESILQDIRNELAIYLKIEFGGEIIGYGGFWHVVDEAHITNIAILPQHRGKGLGGLLMQALMDKASKFQASSIILEVRRDNIPAQKLYKKYGFVCIGVRPKYYQDGVDALIFWRELPFVAK